MSETAEAGKPRELEVDSRWVDFMLYCKELGNGRIERLIIRNGVPAAAEMFVKRTNFK